MIISRTPLRISFLGGGTDFPDFYEKHGGEVLSSAIDKYIYICVHKHFDGKKFLLKYSKVEEGEDVEKIEHPLIRECMKMADVSGVEVVSMSDAPVYGVGLGSSGSFAVGLLNALFAFRKQFKTPEELAEMACKIEIEILKNPVGKQDQYIAAFGGLKTFIFNKNGKVEAIDRKLTEDENNKFGSNLLLFYTGECRQSSSVLSEQKARILEKEASLLSVKKMAACGAEQLLSGNFEEIGKLMMKNWEEKKQWASTISNKKINDYYQKAIDAGAFGGKICGAGGGGFFLFYCPRNGQAKLRSALHDLKEFKFHLEPDGTKIIYDK